MWYKCVISWDVIQVCDIEMWYKCVISRCDTSVWYLDAIQVCDIKMWYKCVISRSDYDMQYEDVLYNGDLITKFFIFQHLEHLTLTTTQDPLLQHWWNCLLMRNIATPSVHWVSQTRQCFIESDQAVFIESDQAVFIESDQAVFYWVRPGCVLLSLSE